MTFQSISFISVMLPIILILYYIIPTKWRTLLLLGTSILLYGFQEPKYVFLLLLLVIVNYYFVRYMDKQSGKERKNTVIEIILINVGILAYFKYYSGFLHAILPSSYHIVTLIMPLGMSFFLFQMMGYIFDVYYQKIPASNNILDVMFYIFYFPKLSMGPIVPYTTFEDQRKDVKTSLTLFNQGAKRFIIGLAQKVILASTFSAMITSMELQGSAIIDHWLILMAYTLQIYFDFAGYSNMAIGISSMLGYPLIENFNYPYISKSISEFWRRWHISLGAWFREYVYIPLGGNRVSKKRHMLNLLAVWILTGIWHGSTFTFVLWGLYFWVLVILEKYVLHKFFNQLPDIIQWLITLLLVMIGWQIFRSNTLLDALVFIKSLFIGSITSKMSVWYIRNYGMYLFIGMIASLPIITKIKQQLSTKHNTIMEIGEALLYGILLIISIAYVIGGTYQSFLYAQF